MTITEWAQFICIGIGGAFGLVCLFEGARRMAGRDASGRGGPAFRRRRGSDRHGGRLCLLAVLGVHRRGDVVPADGEQVRELPAEWGKKMSPAQAGGSEPTRGARRFISSGKLGQYFDVSGQRKVYAPAQDDLKQRESVLATAARLEHKASDSFNEFILWLVLGLSAAVFGLCFAFEPRGA